MKPNEFTIESAIKSLKDKRVSSKEIALACLERIRSVDTKLRAFITVDEEKVIYDAAAKDKEIEKGGNIFEDKPLLGIPISIKDNFLTLNLRTTAASKVLEDFMPPYEATVVRKLKDAGAIILGKTNMDAWAHGSSTETSDFFTTRNPWDLSKLPGGSSGGSAAAVAADETIAAIGSETAGSIRQPSSWCGVVGLKPTYGRASRYGLIAMASSLDCPGPITKTVYDSALILSVISGKDHLDATTLLEKSYTFRKTKVSGMKIGIAKSYFDSSASPVARKVLAAVKILEKFGIKLKVIDLLDPKYSVAVYTIIQRSEVSSNLARYDGIRYGKGREFFADEAKRRIMLGTYTLSEGYWEKYYKKAQQVRSLIIQDFSKAFANVDAIVGPTTPSTALPVGATAESFMFGEIQDRLAEPSSLAGLPAINVPCGFYDKLPVGLQIIAPQKGENVLINIALLLEKELDINKFKPIL